MSFFKNILTLGKHGKLQDELQLLQEKNWYLTKLNSDFQPLKETQWESFNLLKLEREAAYKNLFLAKTLISKIKVRLKSQQLHLETDNLTNVMLSGNNSHLDLRINGDISIDFDNLGSELFENISASLDYLGSQEKISSTDLKVEGLKMGVSALVSGVDALIDMNQEVRQQRELVRDKLIEVTNSVTQITKYFPTIYAETHRAIEIALTLNKTNQIFVNKYEQINKRLFNKSKIRLFWDEFMGRRLSFDQEDESELLKLIQICSEYKKISSIKIEKIGLDS